MMSGPHRCESVVIGRADFRLDKTWPLQQFGPHDRVSTIEGVCDVCNPTGRDILHNQIALSVRLHASSQVVLLEAANRPNAQTNLDQAAAAVRTHFPDLKVVTAIQPLDEPVADQSSCTVIAFGCMDFRLSDWVLGQYGPYDRVSLAGGARVLIDPATQELALHQIAEAVRLHQITTVVTANHDDCGAYGGSAGFNHDKAKERATYESDLARASAVVHSHFPDLEVIAAIQALDGSVTDVTDRILETVS